MQIDSGAKQRFRVFPSLSVFLWVPSGYLERDRWIDRSIDLHASLSLSGSLPTPSRFSCSLSVGHQGIQLSPIGSRFCADRHEPRGLHEKARQEEGEGREGHSGRALQADAEQEDLMFSWSSFSSRILTRKKGRKSSAT